MAGRRHTAEAWDAAQRLYFGELLAVARISRITGISQRAIRTRAAREGWRRPVRSAAAPGLEADAAGGADMPAADRAEVLARLWAALDAELHMARDEAGGAATRLPNLVRTLERLIALERGFADAEADGGGPDAGAGGAADDMPGDADDFRDEIARRLEGLLAGGAD